MAPPNGRSAKAPADDSPETADTRWTRAKRVLHLTRSQWPAIALILILTLILATLSAVEPLVLKYIFDGLGRPDPLTFVIWGVGMLLAIGLARELSSMFANRLTWRTRINMHYRLLDLTVERLHRLPCEMHRNEGAGGIMTRLDRSLQSLINAISEVAFNILPAVVYLAIALTIMFRMDWRLTLLVVVFTPLPILIANRAAPTQKRREKYLLDKWGRIYSRFNEVLSGIVTVRSFAMEDAEKHRFLSAVDEANQTVVRGVRYDSGVGALQNLSVFAARLCGIALGGYMVTQGRITLGTLVAFLSYMGGLFAPVQGLTGIYRTLRMALVAVDHVFHILDTPDHITDAPHAVCPQPVKGHVVFDNVDFAYDPADRMILDGINLDVAPGRVIAIVGPSGSGKSTMMSLLQRFHDPTAGSVRLDGKDLRDIKQQNLRRSIGVVMQDALLFNESVRACIAYGKSDATQQQIEDAARAANAHDFIMQLEHGYDTVVGERGARFSGGERQRIAIARAILKDPSILILDEATSALDAETEFLVQQALERLITNRTTFVIAHRLATVVHADQILVLKQGRIIEQGRHKELLEQDGYYASLVKRQTHGLLAA
ncbi:MAG: ABC transporter ATP-binding protein [Phycisphaerae bacterium]|nr:ABC transporter ATP-binding protein [Phycisphaerae bacterium]